MQIGLLTAIFADLPFQEVVEYAANVGYQCLEVACWPVGKKERRYAGVSHIDVERVLSDSNYAKSIFKLCEKHHIQISALSYYPNPLDPIPQKREDSICHLKKVIQAAKILEVPVVGTFIGRDQTKTIEENLKLFQNVWPHIIQMAEKCRVKIAIENCPMFFTNDEWPAGKNIAVSPQIWRTLFSTIDSQYFGLNFDPSHFVWQQMDYIKALYEFKDKIYHLHFKDIAVSQDKLNQVGVLAPPLEYMSPRIPGHGDVDWKAFISAVYDLGLSVPGCVEIEDCAFEGNLGLIKESVELSYRYLKNYLA